MVTGAMKLRWLLLGRKAMTNLDSILKSRDVSLTGREEGGGFGMGNTCIPVADSC